MISYPKLAPGLVRCFASQSNPNVNKNDQTFDLVIFVWLTVIEEVITLTKQDLAGLTTW